MGRLFWKFFLAFWLALLLAGAAVGTLVWLHQQRSVREEPVLAAGPRAALALQAASATLRHGGEPALRALLDDAAPPWNATIVYAVDRHGRDLLGREVPADALARARLLAARPGAPHAARVVRVDEPSGLLLFVPFAADGTIRPMPRPARFGRTPERFPPLLLAAIGLIASVAFSALLAWSLTRPIRHLRSAVTSFSEGRLETRVAPLVGGRGDELAELGRDFDRMAQQLQQLLASQRRLLHDVSHELRSPLARLQAAVGLARQNPERVPAMLGRIERDASRLDELVGELLALARLEAGQALPEPQ
jgi:two-component system OmpR family sensor kinase